MKAEGRAGLLRDPMRYFNFLVCLGCGYSAIIILGYDCPSNGTGGSGNQVIEALQPITDVVAPWAPLVEAYSAKMTAWGLPCNIDLMRHIYSVNFLILVLSYGLSLRSLRRFLYDFPDTLANPLISDWRKRQKLLSFVGFFVVGTVAGLYGYLWDTLDLNPADLLSNQIHLNKWYVLLDGLLVAYLSLFLSTTTALIHCWYKFSRSHNSQKTVGS